MKQTVTASSSFLLDRGNSLCTVTDVTMPRTSKMPPLSKEILEPENIFCSWNELQMPPHAGHSVYYKTKIYVSMSSVSFLPDNFKETNNKKQGLNKLKQLKPPPQPNKKKKTTPHFYKDTLQQLNAPGRAHALKQKSSHACALQRTKVCSLQKCCPD